MQQMENYFDEVIPENLLLRIDELQLNLGTVSINDLEYVIEERFICALQEELSVRLKLLKDVNNASLSGIAVETIGTGKLELLEYFLMNGIVPWYADSGTGFSIDELLNKIIQVDKAALKNLFKKTGTVENVRKRISYQFNENSILLVIRLLEPFEADYIIRSHHELSGIQKTKQIFQTEAVEFSKAMWLFIFNYLLIESSSEFSKKMFIRSNISQMAAYFGIEYNVLLHFFYDAMEQQPGSLYTPLKSVLFELFTEDTENKTLILIKGKREVEKIFQPADIAAKFELIEYFLRIGTLPHRGENISNTALLEMMLEVAKMAPATIKKLLLSIGPSGINQSALSEMLGPREIKDLTRLIFHEKVRELDAIAVTFQTLLSIHTFSGFNAAEISRDIWKYLMNTLLFLGNDEVTDRDFVKLLMKDMEWKYRLAQGSVMNALSISLQKADKLSSQFVPANSLFKEVVSDLEVYTGGIESKVYKDLRDSWKQKESRAQGREFVTTQLYDVLRYLLKYGHIPWWGRNYYSHTISTMIDELFGTDPDALVIMMRETALIPQMKNRFLENVRIRIAQGTFSRMYQGKEAVNEMNSFMVVLQVSELMKYHDEDFVQKTILKLAWDIFGRTGYALFSGLLFYVESIKRFSEILHTQPGFIVSKLMWALDRMQMNAPEPYIREWLSYVKEYFIDYDKQTQSSAAVEYENADSSLSEVKQKQTLFANVAFADKDFNAALTYAGDLLQYFLKWERLPDTVGMVESDLFKVMMRAILMLMFRNDRLQLNNILSDGSNSKVARIWVNELFSESEGGAEKQLSFYLWQKYIPETEETGLAFQDDEIRPYLELYNDLLQAEDIFFNELAPDVQKNEHALLDRSRKTLQFFIMASHLPDEPDLKITGDKGRVILSVLLYVYKVDPGFVNTLFQFPESSIEAKMQIYDLLAGIQDPAAFQLNNLLENIRERDFIQLLSSKEINLGEQHKETLSSLLMNKLQESPVDEYQDMADRLFSSTSFAKMILDRYGYPVFIQMASRKQKKFAAEDSIIQQWYSLIQKAIPHGLEKERILDLFKRFNIIFISVIAVNKSDEEYTLLLVKYLSAHLMVPDLWVYEKLFEFVSGTGFSSFQAMEGQRKLIMQSIRQVISNIKELKEVEKERQSLEDHHLAVVMNEEMKDYRNRQLMELKTEKENAEKKLAETAQGGYEKLLEDTGESIYIGNCGLVLFHPFYATYFSRTGLTENGSFRDLNSRNRAVLLLQYLANGNTGFSEQQLVLNKILCNVPLGEAIPVSFNPTEEEINVTAELFEVFKERWAKVKNSSAAAIQQTFILREGMLKLIDGNWNLIVEQKGTDILLQSYPWAFGYIKTPWMNNTLIVEWI
jgi:hypothetical protein